jgi:hypothetical protein
VDGAPCSHPERIFALAADAPAASKSPRIETLRQWSCPEETHMAQRTTQAVVHFSAAFLLPGFDEPQPPGDYRVDHDEESIDGAAWLAWRRVGLFIHLPAIGRRKPRHEVVPVDPQDLDAALERDRNSDPNNYPRTL